MDRPCFICDISVGDKNTSDLFSEYIIIDESTAQLLSEIVDKEVAGDTLHSPVLCKKCHNICMEFDSARKRVQEIKTELTKKFKTTLMKHDLENNSYAKKVTPVATPKKIVLPASKLQPLPANYVIDLTKIPRSVNIPSPTINLKVTVGSTVLTQSLKSTSPQKTPTNKAVETNIANSLSSILGTKTSTSVSSDSSMLTFNIDDVPKDFIKESTVSVKIEDDDLNNDEQPMEIDEECTVTKINNDSPEDGNNKDSSEKFLFDVSLLPLAEGENNETILGKLQILDQGSDEEDNDGETDEIVMRDDSGSVIRLVMGGQQLVYDTGALTLAKHDDDTTHDNDDDDNDSNDESQIELQVSGDEETANAIIAAAREQGGAFIKVESGEMFRVKSVKSQKGNSNEDDTPAIQMVELKGNQFTCLLCENADRESVTGKQPFVGGARDTMQHLRSEHDARLYICPHCLTTLRRRAQYNKHIAECVPGNKLIEVVSDNKKLYECAQCNKKFTSKALLQEHINMHEGTRPYVCTVCGKAFASKYTHGAHLKTHLDRPRPFQCKQCEKTFMTQQNLNQHEKTHLGVKDFVCNICYKAFSTQHNLEVHGVVHSKTKPFVCGVCGKPFARRAEVKDHVRIHTGERPFACDVCGATFSQRSNLYSHKRATHSDDRRHACAHCPKRFKRRRLLDYHIKVSHTGERPLRCEVCNATFVYPEHYKKHARIHSGEKPFVCEVCGKSFNSRDNRNTHRFVHSDKKPYECLVCGAGFMRKQLLYAHMNTSGGATVTRLKSDSKLETLISTEGDEELELSTSKIEEVHITETPGAQKYILQDVQQTDDPALLTLIQNLDGSKQEATSYQTIAADQIGDQVQMVTTDENGAIRLVQLHIGNNSGAWLTTMNTQEIDR